MQTKILKLNDGLLEKYESQIREIFFLSSSIQEFENDQKKEAFFELWCGQYIKKSPNTFYLAIQNGVLVGYCSVYLDTAKGSDDLQIPGQNFFKEYFNRFPAHLHINCHPLSRGMGVGRDLLEHIAGHLRQVGCAGVHIITGPGARNNNFYRKNHYDFEVSKESNGNSLLFMGCKLL